MEHQQSSSTLSFLKFHQTFKVPYSPSLQWQLLLVGGVFIQQQNINNNNSWGLRVMSYLYLLDCRERDTGRNLKNANRNENI